MASLRSRYAFALFSATRVAQINNNQTRAGVRRTFYRASHLQQDSRIHTAVLFMQQNSRLERQTRLIEERAPLSLSAKQIQSKLQSGHADPFSAMQEYLKRGEADPDVVRVCLVAAKEKMFKVPRAARIAEAEPRQFARTVLIHIFSDPMLWVPIVVNDFRACDALCWFAVAEGLSDKILDWLEVEVDVSRFLPADVAGKSDLWRNALLCSLVEAHSLHISNSDASPAIACLLEAMARKKKCLGQIEGQRKENSRNTIAYMSEWPSISKLTSSLTSSCGIFFKTDPVMYDAVVELRKRFITKSTEFKTRLALAHLASWHPTRQSAIPAFKLIHELVTMKGRIYGENDEQTDSIARLMIQAHGLLKKDPAHDKVATWMSTTYQKAFSSPIPSPVAPGVPKQKVFATKDGSEQL